MAVPGDSNLPFNVRPGGALTVVTGTNPAANTEISETVPAGQTWELIAVTVQLVQGATQTPQPVLVIDDGATTLLEVFGATGAQAASTTCRYTWSQGNALTALIGATTNVRGNAPLPNDLTIGPGFRIRTTTIGIGANSDYGAPTMLVRKFT